MAVNINDLLKQYKKKGAKPKVSTNEVEAKFEEKMRDIAIKQKEEQASRTASSKGWQYINLVGFPISPDTLVMVDKDNSENLKIICFFYGDHNMKLGAVNPEDPKTLELVELLKQQYDAKIEMYLITEHSFNSAFKLFASVPVFKKIDTGVTITDKDLEKFQAEISDFKTLNKKIKEVNISDIITLIIAAALKGRSSDIHIEAEEEDIKARFRIDGVLHDIATLDKELWPKVISRIKLLSKLKLNITKQPQDGRFTIFLSEKEKVDVRVSCLPTAFGESVVMRILKATSITLQFEDLGIRGASFKRLKEEVDRPQGMIVTTGPTGSGKTTSLYAILNKLNKEETKIITLEDPIEYKLVGINQSQIDHSKGYNFADGLRSILRQDPDVVMVGELRDLETADVAINAALTGHLVISTIHTNSAAGAIPRFLSMGIKPFLLAPALNAIIGQRLVRLICKNCKEEMELDSNTLQRVLKVLSEISPMAGEKVDTKNMKFFHGKGCDECNGIGYKGRIGIYEILAMTKEIEAMILSGKVSEYDMKDIGIKNGMVLMVQDGILKALDGDTTVEEVFRVTE